MTLGTNNKSVKNSFSSLLTYDFARARSLTGTKANVDKAMLSSGVNRSDSTTAFGAGLIYCSSWGSGNGKFLMFLIIYNVPLTGRSKVINTSFLVRCFRLWGGSREAPAWWGPPVPRHPRALQHPPLGSEQPDRPMEAAAHAPVRTTHMVVNVSQCTRNKKIPGFAWNLSVLLG